MLEKNLIIYRQKKYIISFMKVLNLLEELEELIDTASSVPLTGKTIINKEDFFELIKEIKLALPDEIAQAKHLVQERESIINDAKMEFDKKIKAAELERDLMVEEHEITKRAVSKADDILNKTEKHCLNLKLKTYEHIDKMLYDFQDKINKMYEIDFQDIFNKIQSSFENINGKLADNRENMHELADKVKHEALKKPE